MKDSHLRIIRAVITGGAMVRGWWRADDGAPPPPQLSLMPTPWAGDPGAWGTDTHNEDQEENQDEQTAAQTADCLHWNESGAATK